MCSTKRPTTDLSGYWSCFAAFLYVYSIPQIALPFFLPHNVYYVVKSINREDEGMEKAKWRRIMAVLLCVCIIGNSGVLPDSFSFSHAALGGDRRTAATGSDMDAGDLAEDWQEDFDLINDLATDADADLEDDLELDHDGDLENDLATGSDAEAIIVEVDGYVDDETPLKVFQVEEGVVLEELPLPETLQVFVQEPERSEEPEEKKADLQRRRRDGKATASNATASDADMIDGNMDGSVDEYMEDEDIDKAEKATASDAEEAVIFELPVAWVQADGQVAYSGTDGEVADFVPAWDYEAYPFAEDYEPNLFVTVMVGDYPSIDTLEADEDKAVSFFFADEDAEAVEEILDREIAVAHKPAFSFSRMFRGAEDYRFDNYYILYKNNLGTKKNDEVQDLTGNMADSRQLIKYQIDFHNDVQYEIDEVEIRVPYVIYNDRELKGVTFSDIGIPEKPYVNKSSSFSYEIDEAVNQIVITNNRAIRAGTNNFLQIFYALDDMMTIDGTKWTIEPELKIKGEVQLDTGRPLTGSMDTKAELTATNKTAYTQNNKQYYPELYTVNQVEYALGTELQEPYKSRFEDYRFMLWITEINGHASQPWELTVTDIPGEGGKVVGQYIGEEYTLPSKYFRYFFQKEAPLTWKAQRYGFGTKENYGLDSRSDRGDADRKVYIFSIAAYPKNVTRMTNTITVNLKGIDGNDNKTLTGTAEWGWENYVWNYSGNIIGINKDYGHSQPSDNMADSWLRVYRSNAGQGRDTVLPHEWNIYGEFRGYSLATVNHQKKYNYTLGIGDDFLYASSGSSGGSKTLLDWKDYYYSRAKVYIWDYTIDIYEDMTSVSAEGEGAYIYVMTADQPERWQAISDSPVPYEELRSGYELPQEWISKGVYRIKAEHTSDEFATNCQIKVETALRYDSPVIWGMLDQKSKTIQLENLGAVYGKTNCPGFADRWFQTGWDNDFGYKPYDEAGLNLTGKTYELYNDNSSRGDNRVMRWNDTVTLTDIQELSEANKYGKARNNAKDSQVDLTYQLTAWEGYRVFGEEAVPVLEQNGIYPARSEVVLYDLLPLGVSFNPARSVTAGYMTDLSHAEISRSWITDGVNVDYEVIDDYKQSGRQMVIFTLSSNADGRDRLEWESRQEQYKWWSGWGVEFEAYYPWEDADIANGAENLMVYQAPDGVVRGNPYADNGTWAPESVRQWMIDLDEDGNTTERNILYDTCRVSLDNAVSGRAEIQKTVKEDADMYGTPERYAQVQTGKGYTYTLTLTNGANETKDIVIFDNLEHAISDRAEQDDMDFEETGWNGSFVYSNVEALREKGVDVKLYYSSDRNAPRTTGPEGDKVQGNNVLTEANGWIPAEEWTKAPEEVRSVAYDLTKKPGGGDFVLPAMESLTLDIAMRAPEQKPANANYAYNNPAYYGTTVVSGSGETSDTVVGDSTRVGLYNTTGLWVEKKEVLGAGAPKDMRFPFSITVDGSPYAYRAYNLYENTGEGKVQLPGIYGTNKQGVLFLKEGQSAEFTGMAAKARYKVEEQLGFRWESQSEGSEGIFSTDPQKPSQAVFTNTYHPLLYFEKKVEFPQEYTDPNDEFAFTLEINGKAAANRRYYKVNPNVDVKKEPELLEPDKVFQTNAAGQFALKAGERICLVMDTGDTYGITELPQSYGADTDYDCDTPVVSGVMEEKISYSYKVISNIYRFKQLRITKEVVVKDGDAPDPEKKFTFVVRLGKDDQSLMPYGNQRYVVLDAEGNKTGSGTTTADGSLELAHGQTAVFQKMQRGMSYEVEEKQEDSNYEVISPSNGVVEGTIPKYALSTEARFQNRSRLRDLVVTKQVICPSGTEGSAYADEFKFILRLNDLISSNTSFIRTDASGTETPASTSWDGSFSLKHGETARFQDILEGTSYEITEQQTDRYVQTIPEDGKPATGVIGNETAPTKEEFVNHSNNGLLTVTKTVQGLDGGEASSVDKEVEFLFKLTLNGEPWEGKTYTWKGPDYPDTPALAPETEAGGKFWLKHGESATFTNMPYGISYEIVELNPKDYQQITPAEGKPASGTIEAKTEVGFVNRNVPGTPGGSEPLVIEKKLIDGEGVPAGFAEWCVEQIDHNYDSLDSFYNLGKVFYTPILLQFDGKPYEGEYLVSGPGNREEIKRAIVNQYTGTSTITLYPGQKAIIYNLPEGVTYTLKEVVRGYGGFINYKDSRIECAMDQVIPEEYGAIEGTIVQENNYVEFVNEVKGDPNGTLNVCLFRKHIDGVAVDEISAEEHPEYIGENLTYKLLRKGDGGEWVPAEGITYRILPSMYWLYGEENGTGVFPTQVVGSDGKITLTAFSYQRGNRPPVVGGLIVMLNLYYKDFEENYKLVEVEEETSPHFGKYVGFYNWGNQDGAIVYNYHDVTADEDESLRVYKKVAPNDRINVAESFAFQIFSGNSSFGTGSVFSGYNLSEEQTESYRAYRLFEVGTDTDGNQTETEVIGNEPYRTDENGVFYLKDGQYALFEGLQSVICHNNNTAYPIGTLYHVKELAKAGYEVSVVSEGDVATRSKPPIGPGEVLMIPGITKSVTFMNTYDPKPGLTVQKKRIGDNSWQWSETDFTFTLNVDSNPYADEEYRLFANDGTEIENTTTVNGINVVIPWTTNEYGEFTMKADQYVKFDWIGTGKHYEITEDPVEGFTQVSPASGTGITGVIQSTGNTETFINQYGRSFGAVVVRKFLSFPSGLPMSDAEFQFQITVDNREYGMKDYKVYNTNANTHESIRNTDSSGRFTLKAGQYAVFEDVPAGVDYEVRELLPEGSDYRILSPASGLAGGVTNSGTSVEAQFVNAVASFMVTKSVISVEGSQAPEGDVFTFEVSTEGAPLAGGKYWLYDADNERIDRETHTTDEQGRFTLKDGEKALFYGIPAGSSYQVRELPKQYYSQIVPVNGGSYEGTVGDTVEVLPFQNQYSREAAFSVRKHLVDGTEAEVTDDETVFTFKLTVNGRIGSGRIYTLNGSNEEYRTDQDGQFQLKHGDVAHFRGLRDGDRCEVEEIHIPDGYTAEIRLTSRILKAGKSLGVDPVTGTVYPGITEETELVAVNRKAPKIWVENTTGDDTPDDDTDDNQGGTVAVRDAGGNIIVNSQNSVSSGGTDTNTEGRYRDYQITGMPESGWEVSVSDITFGPMGEDGVSGAVFRLGDLPRTSAVPETGDYYNPSSGRFAKTCSLVVDGVDRDFVIEGVVSMDNSTRAVTVAIENMAFDVDLGIRFRKSQYELPRTGGPGTIPLTLAGMTLMYLSARELKRKRRRAGSTAPRIKIWKVTRPFK